jgi:hypothetical protein
MNPSICRARDCRGADLIIVPSAGAINFQGRPGQSWRVRVSRILLTDDDGDDDDTYAGCVMNRLSKTQARIPR